MLVPLFVNVMSEGPPPEVLPATIVLKSRSRFVPPPEATKIAPGWPAWVTRLPATVQLVSAALALAPRPESMVIAEATPLLAMFPQKVELTAVAWAWLSRRASLPVLPLKVHSVKATG